MKRIIQSITISMLLLLGACYNDAALKENLLEIEARINTLEKLCADINTNISSLQTIVTGLQARDHLTNVTPVKENNVEVGYTLTFAKAGTVTIRYGKNGADGKVPQIGIKAEPDGQYYWTLNGELLKTTAGNAVKVNGKDGTNGITPQLKIENDFWFLSTDNGATWKNLGKAVGADGQNAKSFFQSITQTDDNVTFTLADGTIISLPKQQTLIIEFSSAGEIAINPEGTLTLTYAVKGVKNMDKLMVKTFVQNGWSASVTPDTGNSTGKLTVTAPATFTDKDAVLVWVYDGDDRTIMASLNFVTGVIILSDAAFIAESTAHTREVKVETNLEYTVEIPSDAKSWISVAETRSTRTETLTFTLAENTGAQRSAIVNLKSIDGKLIKSIAFIQKSVLNEQESITFVTTKAIGQNILLMIDAELADRESVWIDLNNNGIKDSGEGISSFSSTDVYSQYRIESQTITIYGKIIRLICSNNEITAIDVSNAASLTRLISSNNQLTALDVTKNTPLRVLWCNNNQLTALDVSKNPNLIQLVCRYNQLTELNLNSNGELLSLDCSDNQLPTLDLNNNTRLQNLYCYGNKLVDIDVSENTELMFLGVGDNQLTELDVSKNTTLASLYCYGNNLNTNAIAALIESLPARMATGNGTLGLLVDTDENNATPTSTDIAVANSKNWIVWKWDTSAWVEMKP